MANSRRPRPLLPVTRRYSQDKAYSLGKCVKYQHILCLSKIYSPLFEKKVSNPVVNIIKTRSVLL